MPRRIPIRLKLTAALAIPIAALLVVASIEVLQSAGEAQEVRDQTNLATAAVGPAGLITNLLNERNYGSSDLIGVGNLLRLPVEDFDEAMGATDGALAAFRADIEDRGGDVAEAYLPVLDDLEQALQPLRDQVIGFEGERNLGNQEVSDPVFQGYTEVIARLFETNTQVALVVDDPSLRRGAELNDLSVRQLDAIARLVRTLLLGAVSPGGLDQPTEISDASALYGEVLSNQEAIRSLGTGPYRDITQRLHEESDSTGFVDLVGGMIENGEVEIQRVLSAVSVEPDFSYYGYPARLKEVIDQQADDLNADAQARQQWYLALAALAVLVALVVTWLVSRSITQPLRSLTNQAKEMAEHRLPDAVLDILETPLGDDVDVPHIEPVVVRTRDEVADVAEALNTVQDSALDLAVEQAVLRRNIADSFVNLGRRNQNLLGRQLDFITELESNETDPDTLASLFRLDHLATRMRRNAESLLVLAGIDPPRKWAAPVRLTDVIRAALGEVEDYQRVTVRGVEPATILGSAAADLAHLIAEFIENALTFSPPDQNVDIRGRHRTDTGGYTLAIIDSGLGMPPADIEAANRRLSGTESFTIAPSKYLGHYVAGNLAARHGIGLRLESSPGNGITATIDLPPALLTAEAPPGDPITDPHGVRAVGVVRPAQPGPAEPAAGVPAGMPPAAPAAAGAGVGAPGPGMDEGAGPPDPFAAPPVGLPGTPPAAAAAAAHPPAAAPARTASGLVKRPTRGRAGNGGGPAAVPDDNLLATLSSYTSNLPTARDRAPILPGKPGPMSSLFGRAPGSPSPSREAHQPPPAGPAPPAPPAPPDGGWADAGWPDPVAPAPNGVPPSAPAPPPAPAAPDAGGAPPSPGVAANPVWAGLANLTTGPRPVVPTPADRSAPPRPPLDPTSGGTTSSGLARRVKGAQLPSTQPLSLRRSSEHAGTGDRGYGLGERGATNGNGEANHGDGGPAKDVYSFLSSFTAGVQRGLDEARRNTTTPEDES